VAIVGQLESAGVAMQSGAISVYLTVCWMFLCPNSILAHRKNLRHLRSSLARRYHPAGSNCERIRSEHFLDFMKQRHSPLLRSGPPV